MADSPSTRQRISWIARECIAGAIWAYIFVKLFVFDIDIYIIDHFAPQFRWVIDYKAFGIAAVAAVALAVLRPAAFLKTALYVGAYPVVFLFWRLPKVAFARWPAIILLAPVVYRLASTFRSTFVLYTVASLSILAIVMSTDHGLLGLAILGLGVFIGSHLFRSFKKAYGKGAFARLAFQLAKLRGSVEKGTFDMQQPQPSPGAGAASPAAHPRPIPLLYLLGRTADIVDEKVRTVADSRKYDFCLVFGWIYTVALTCLVFAFEYFALYRINPASFKSAEGASLWAFLGFSLGALTPARASGILPATRITTLVYYTEAACSVLVLVILVFTVLTAAREAFKHDVEVFGTELKLTADSIDVRISQVYSMTLSELELVCLKDQAGLINWLRKQRGLPALAPPPAGELSLGAVIDQGPQTDSK